MSTHPEVLWAQRSSESDDSKNVIYLTVSLPNIDEPSLKYDLTPTSIKFEADARAATNAETKHYEFSLDLYDDIIPELSKHKLTSRSFTAVLRKKNKKLEFWPRLTKEKLKTPFIKTDFEKWVDEDEQDAARDDDFGMGDGLGDMDFSKMLGGDTDEAAAESAPNPEDEAESDDNDEDGPPPLEDA
ncbi:HSP20-like chaperone [Pisolithus croceorrhizus]|nr:HSP20-like chaperone [Pisolithus croceorrhizus]